MLLTLALQSASLPHAWAQKDEPTLNYERKQVPKKARKSKRDAPARVQKEVPNALQPDNAVPTDDDRKDPAAVSPTAPSRKDPTAAAPPKDGPDDSRTWQQRIQDSIRKATSFQYKFGVFGNIHGGVTMTGFGDLATNLQAENAIGQGYQQPFWGTTLGGSIQVLLAKRLIVGINGSYYGYHESDYTFGEGDNTEFKPGVTRQNAYTLGLNLGYCLISKNQWLLYPYAGFGFGQSSLEIKNYEEDTLFFGDVGVDGTDNRTFTAPIMAAELGISTKFNLSKQGGMMLGVDLGGFFNVAPGEWSTAEGATVNEVEPNTWMGGYLRFTLGGGLFTKTDGPWPPKPPRVKYPKPVKNKGGKAKPTKQKPVEAEPADLPPPPVEDPKKEKKKKKDKKEEDDGFGF